MGVPLNWTCHGFLNEWFDLHRFHAPHTLNLTVLRLFVDPLIRRSPPKLDPDVLSHSLNDLCKMSLGLNASKLNIIPESDPVVIGNYQVIPANAFPRCDDIIDGMGRPIKKLFPC